MQSAAEAAAVGGARMLASSVILRGTAVAFNSSAETVYCEARRFAEANLGYARDPSTLTLTIEFANSVTPTVWRPVSAATCPTTGSTPVASDTVFVRATVHTTVPAIGARIVGIISLDTGAAARAQISGAAPPLLPTLPVIREFDPSLVSCAQCQPSALTPLPVWANNDQTSTQHSFKGLVDYSRYSSRQAPNAVEQPVTQWDQSGSVDA